MAIVRPQSSCAPRKLFQVFEELLDGGFQLLSLVRQRPDVSREIAQLFGISALVFRCRLHLGHRGADGLRSALTLFVEHAKMLPNQSETPHR